LTELALDFLAIVFYDRKIAFCKSEKKGGGRRMSICTHDWRVVTNEK